MKIDKTKSTLQNLIDGSCGNPSTCSHVIVCSKSAYQQLIQEIDIFTNEGLNIAIEAYRKQYNGFALYIDKVCQENAITLMHKSDFKRNGEFCIINDIDSIIGAIELNKPIDKEKK